MTRLLIILLILVTACGRIKNKADKVIEKAKGKIINELKLNKPGIMINTVDTSLSFYDPSGKFRDLAMKGILTNGPGELNDPRSKDIKNL